MKKIKTNHESPDGSQDALPDDYLEFALDILDDRLEGRSKDLGDFIVSMNLPIEFLKKEFNVAELTALIRDHEIKGTVRYPKSFGGRITEIRYEIVKYRGVEEIYMRSTLGYFLWERVRIQEDKVLFVINWWYHPPANKVDLEILELAQRLLADPGNWHKKDKRKCENDIENNRWSLFCALKYASITKMGEYNHHNTAMQTVRFVIDDLVPNHGFAHTLMDYNNAQTTTHRDIMNVLALAEDRINEEMKNKIDRISRA
jgi:hypothetical protein